jgi:hypothetical protein
MDLPPEGPVGVRGDWAEPDYDTAGAKNCIGAGRRIFFGLESFMARNCLVAGLQLTRGLTAILDNGNLP